MPRAKRAIAEVDPNVEHEEPSAKRTNAAEQTRSDNEELRKDNEELRKANEDLRKDNKKLCEDGERSVNDNEESVGKNHGSVSSEVGHIATPVIRLSNNYIKDESDPLDAFQPTDYLCIDRPCWHFEQEYSNSEEREDSIKIHEAYHSDSQTEARWLKPASDHPNWKWVMMKDAYSRSDDLRTKASYCDPEKNFDMYTYNDFHAYGVAEVLDSQLLAFNTAYIKKDTDQMWIVASAVAHWRSSEDTNMVLISGDGDTATPRVEACGRMFLTALEAVEREGELKAESRFRDLGLVMSLNLKWSADLLQYGIGEEVQCNWRKDVVAYGKAAGVDLTEAWASAEARKAVEDFRDVEAIQAGGGKATKWEWPKTFKELGGEKRGFGTNNQYDITKWTRQARAAKCYKGKDPLANVPVKILKSDGQLPAVLSRPRSCGVGAFVALPNSARCYLNLMLWQHLESFLNKGKGWMAERMDNTEDITATDEPTIPWEIEDCSSGALYTPLDSTKSQIRLLYINSSPCCSEAAICCDLYKVSLDDDPDYAALSYCWGNAKNTVEICLAGRTTLVTRNLASALRRLRDMPQESFWADAICVNQADLDERGQQVRLMMDIYSSAAMVYSYLNDDEDAGTAPGMAGDKACVSEAAVVQSYQELDSTSGDVSAQDCRRDDRYLRRSSLPVGTISAQASNRQSTHVDALAALDLAICHDLYGDMEFEHAGPPDEGVVNGNAESQDGLADSVTAEDDSNPVENDEAPKPELITPPVEIAEKQPTQLNAVEASSVDDTSHKDENMTVLANECILPVLSLMRNRCWRRVWIFQEMVLAEDQVFLGSRTSIARSDFERVCQWVEKRGDGDVVWPRFVEHATWTAWKKQIQTTAMHALVLRRCRALADTIDRSKPKPTLMGPRHELFFFSEDLEARDPRDHVYGLLGILDVRFKPDYHRSVKELFFTWTRWLAYAGPDTRFLRRAGLGHNDVNQYGGLPSWVPDWSSRANCGYSRRAYNASAGLKCDMRVTDSTFIIDGVIVGTIAPRRWQGRGLFLQYYLQLLSNGHPTADPPLQVLYRVLTRDLYPGCKSGTYNRYDPKLLGAFMNFATLLMGSDVDAFALLDFHHVLWSPVTWALNEYFGLESGAGDRWNPLQMLYCDDPGPMTTGDDTIDKLASSLFDMGSSDFESLGNSEHLMKRDMANARLFRINSGYIGSSGISVQAGDLVCVLVGCPNTLVLRKVEDHYIIVEPCFVHGLMYGEVVQLIKDGACGPQQTFEIH
ncbi:hypothetical protein LTR17_010774 [Elasticomyces elasticus]|nr:hypothetical protein LTR17_010774 [Elasticomyces elasticus]